MACPPPAPGSTPDTAASHEAAAVLARFVQAAALERLSVELVVGPPEPSAPLRRVTIVEPDHVPAALDGALALLIGARGAAAAAPVAAAGRAGAAGVLVRTDHRHAHRGELRTAARESGTALLTVGGAAPWDEIEALARTVVGEAAPAAAPAVPVHTDLFALAETVAGLTGGGVTIEDTAHRVLAYSRSGEHADELRRMTILGRACPEEYLDVLRAWGVWERLRGGEDVVRVDEHPGLGIRARLVTTVSAGSRVLGTIWVHQGTAPLSDQAATVLRGAARMAADRLVHGGDGRGHEAAVREELTAGLLAARLPVSTLADHIGIPADVPATLAALDLRRPADTSEEGAAELVLHRAEARRIAGVHAAAFRRNALSAWLGGRLYLLLPGGEAAASTAPGAAAVEWANGLVTAVRDRLGTPVQAAVVRMPQLSRAPTARRDADRVLNALAREPRRLTATFDEMRAAMELDAILALIDEHPETHDAALDGLLAHDRGHGTELAESLLLYLDSFGETTAAAKRLHIHPNTLRYRVRRAAALSGVDLEDPEQRLLAELHLRRALRR